MELAPFSHFDPCSNHPHGSIMLHQYPTIQLILEHSFSLLRTPMCTHRSTGGIMRMREFSGHCNTATKFDRKLRKAWRYIDRHTLHFTDSLTIYRSTYPAFHGQLFISLHIIGDVNTVVHQRRYICNILTKNQRYIYGDFSQTCQDGCDIGSA
jgi:hypothetical protein